MSNIRIDIASEFKDKGFKQADKATGGLQSGLKELGKTLVGVLSVREIYQFGKASLKAFTEDEQAAVRLSQSLGNLGLAFEDTRVSQFISELERTSGVLDDSLRPAMQSLLMTTGSVTKSQDLLNLALEMSRASGVDVSTVAKDLSKAYVGQSRSLSKYNTGLSQVELKTKSFGELQEFLNKQFSGQNAAYLETFGGKVDMLNVAYANMQETVGEGLVDAFAILSGDQGIGAGTKAMDIFADKIADTTRGIATLTAGFKDLASYRSTLVDFVTALAQEANFLKAIASLGEKNKPLFFPTAGNPAAQEAARKKAEAEAAKRSKELLALTKKQVKAQQELNKKKKEEGILGDIAKRFDMERIQVAAALGGQINDVERLRLELMQAILDEDVKRAIILEGQLIKAEAEAKELAMLLDSLDEMVGDPFADWPGTITRIKELLKTLNIKIPIETLFAEKGLRLDQEKMTVTKLERMDVDANNVYINGKKMGETTSGGIGLPDDIVTLFKKGDPDAIAAVEANADANAALADANLLLAEQMEMESLVFETERANQELILADALLAESGGDTNITVIVEGNVISAEDLAETITDIQYTYQRTGKGLLFSSIAI
jgi:hypothetical protein